MVWYGGFIEEEFLKIVIALILIYPIVAIFIKLYQDTRFGKSMEESFEQYGVFYALSISSFVVNVILAIYFYSTYLNMKTVHVVIQLILLITGFTLTVVGSKFFWIEKDD